MQIGSVVWEEFDHLHTYRHTYTRNLTNVALSIRVTLNTKPASQVLIKYKLLYLNISPISPWTDLHQIWYNSSSLELNQLRHTVCQWACQWNGG